MRIQVISDELEFAALRTEWDAVLSASRVDGPFLRHGWLTDWWNAFGVGELAVVTCRDEATGELLGVLPAYRCRIGTMWPTRVVRLLGDGKGGATGLGVFALPHAEEAVWDAVTRTLLAEAAHWDALRLQPLAEGDGFAAVLAGAIADGARSGSVRRIAATHARPCVSLPSTWDEYLSTSLHHDERRNVRRCMRRGDALGARVETVVDAAELPAAVDEAIGLHEERMRQVVSPGYGLDSARRAFVHASCKTLLAEERLRLTFLVIEDRRVACMCQMRHRDTRYAMWTGFLGEWGCEEVGKTLFSHTVRGAIEEGCTTLDFGLGEHAYKSEWGVTRVDRFGSLAVYAPSTRGRVAGGRDASVALAQRTIEQAPAQLREPLWRAAQSARRFIQPR